MDKIVSPFNIDILSNLLQIHIGVGYEFAVMDMVVAVLKEQGFEEQCGHNLYTHFDAIIFGTELPELTEETKRFLRQNQHGFAKRYELIRDLNQPGYLILKTAIERDGTEKFFRYAVELGCPTAARIYAQQLVTKGKYTSARSFLSLAIERGDYLAYSDLGVLEYDLEIMNHDLSKAIFLEGLEKGNSECALEIVDRNLYGDDYMPFIEKAKSLYNPRWHSCLAERLLHEKGKKKDAIAELLSGMEEADAESFAKMGRLYLSGVDECGIPIDLDMALAYTEPHLGRCAEADYVNATAKLIKGKDTADCLVKLSELAESPMPNPELKVLSVIEIGNAFFGRYGEETKKTARQTYDVKALQALMLIDTPFMEAEIACKFAELITEIQEAIQEDEDHE